jgi:signal transduction histidine kinase
MSLLSSFRARFLFGTLLWTAGLLLFAHVMSVLSVIGTHAFHSVLHIAMLLVVSVTVMGVGLSQAWAGLTTLKKLRARVAAVHDGRERQVDGTYPSEIQPLVSDLNVLLEHHDTRVREAVAKAGDLAHGLKTPLAVLSQEVERAEAAGHTELAAVIGQQVERMRRHIDYHLAHARAAASGATPGARASVVASVDGLVRTLERLHAERGVTIDARVAADQAVRTQREDLDEMLGNLLDNACKWARSSVTIESRRHDRSVVIVVDDDGPGLPDSMREAVLQRGVRADQASAGWGLGLAIVRDIADVYGGAITLAASPAGGLRAELTLPAA